MNVTPASSVASTIARHSSTEIAIGFSSSTCLPARAAAIASSACVSWIVQMSTASISASSHISRASVKIADASISASDANCCAASSRISQTAASRTRSGSS